MALEEHGKLFLKCWQHRRTVPQGTPIAVGKTGNTTANKFDELMAAALAPECLDFSQVEGTFVELDKLD